MHLNAVFKRRFALCLEHFLPDTDELGHLLLLMVQRVPAANVCLDEAHLALVVLRVRLVPTLGMVRRVD